MPHAVHAMNSMNTLSSSLRPAIAASPWRAVMPRGVDGAPVVDGFLPSGRLEEPSYSQPPLPGFEAAVSAVAAAAPGPVAATLRLVLLGPPGSGKSTQGEILARQKGIPHISVGQLVRDEIATGTERGRQLEAETRGGNLASAETIRGLVQDRLEQEDARQGFLLDGYPRQLSQVPALEEMRKDLGWGEIRVIGLEVSEDESVRRLNGRGRADDTPEVIRHRLEVYRQETAPVQEYYRARGEYLAVDGNGTVQEVAARVQAAVDGQDR